MRNWFRPWIHGKPHGMTNKTSNRIDRNKEKSNCKCSNGYILKIPPFHVVVIFVFLMDAQDPMIKSLMKSQNYLIIFSLPPPFIILKIVITAVKRVSWYFATKKWNWIESIWHWYTKMYMKEIFLNKVTVEIMIRY